MVSWVCGGYGGVVVMFVVVSGVLVVSGVCVVLVVIVGFMIVSSFN